MLSSAPTTSASTLAARFHLGNRSRGGRRSSGEGWNKFERNRNGPNWESVAFGGRNFISIIVSSASRQRRATITRALDAAAGLFVCASVSRPDFDDVRLHLIDCVTNICFVGAKLRIRLRGIIFTRWPRLRAVHDSFVLFKRPLSACALVDTRSTARVEFGRLLRHSPRPKRRTEARAELSFAGN